MNTKASIQTIYTLDARDNVLLDVLKGFLKLDSKGIYKEINNAHRHCISLLSDLGIKYEQFKNGLIPRSGRKEISYVFDTNKMESASYGHEVFSKLLPLLDKDGINSVLGGDFVGASNLSERLRSLFFNNIKVANDVEYIIHNQFFIVYINNLSDGTAERIDSGLKPSSFYAGFFDLSYSSEIKTYFSTILSKLFVKSGMNIVAPDEETKNGVNVYSYPFEQNGYRCKAIQDMYYGLFLTYKIEREIFPGLEDDTSFAINSLTDNVLDISEFNLLIEDKKHEYLLLEKDGNISRAGLSGLTPNEIASLVKSKMESNYIYNLTFLPDYNTVKFNIIIEFNRVDTKLPMKLMVALEYIAENKTLRLITMF